jgi:YVTN family beta-propeller protein
MTAGATFRIRIAITLWVSFGSLFLACQRPQAPKPYIAYVLNHQSATLAAMNLAELRVVSSIAVSPEPDRVLLRPGARQLYVVSSLGKINIVAFPRLRHLATVAIGRSAKDLAFSPDGRIAYALNPTDRELVFLDCAAGLNNSPENAIPTVTYRLHLGGALSDLALTPDGKTLIAASSNPDLLTFIDVGTRQPVGSIGVGQAPGPMVILPDNSKIFVADTREEKVSVADIASHRLLAHLEIGVRPSSLLLKPDGGEIFVLASAASRLIILDAFHDDVEQTFPLGQKPSAGTFSRDGAVLYVANSGDGSVLALDVQNRAELASPHVGIEPWALALTPDQRFLLAADRAGSSLAVLRADTVSLSNDRSVLVTTVPVGAAPVDVVIPDEVDFH